jgi:hypothetical protein
VRLTKRTHANSERVKIEQFLDREPPRVGVAPATAQQLLIALIEMLRQLLDDLLLARGAQSQWRETRAQVRGPLRHGRLQ